MTFTLLNFWSQYDIFFYAGITSTTAYTIAKIPFSFMKFIRHLVQATFVAVIVGIVTKNFTAFDRDILFAASAISGYFALDILREIKEILQKTSDIVTIFARKRLGLNAEKPQDNE